jgi:hypothetical protein
MKMSKLKTIPGTPFTIEWSTLENAPGTWDSELVSIYRDRQQIGQYQRNYPNLADKTFAPFLIGDQWYALYSDSYLKTRVMKINSDSIEHWCDATVGGADFCPTEYYIPQYTKFIDDNLSYYVTDGEFEQYAQFAESRSEPGYIESGYFGFGFIAGCCWGDDSTVKLRYIDLSKIPDRSAVIEEKFGYWELPNRLSLRECVDLSIYDDDNTGVNLLSQAYRSLK